eukprot:2386983-Karenia_brevis.AAC.1
MVFVFRTKRDIEHPEAIAKQGEPLHVEEAIVNAASASTPVPAPVGLFTDVDWSFDVGHATHIQVTADKTIIPKNFAKW